MFCPKCGQERISEATSFCSRCGYLLTGTAELMQTGGASEKQLPESRWWSPRSRGIRQGIFMILLMFVIAPIVGLISKYGFDMPDPWPVGIVVAIFGAGGLLRIIYALMFEAKAPAALVEGPREIEGRTSDFVTSALPPQSTIPASEYASPRSQWRDDVEALEPTSVTDNTTKLLEKDAE